MEQRPRRFAAVAEGDQPATNAEGVRFVGVERDGAGYEIQSGRYCFTSAF